MKQQENAFIVAILVKTAIVQQIVKKQITMITKKILHKGLLTELTIWEENGKIKVQTKEDLIHERLRKEQKELLTQLLVVFLGGLVLGMIIMYML